MTRSIVFGLLVLAAPVASAGPAGTPLSEPGSLALLGMGVVAAVVIAIRNRRK